MKNIITIVLIIAVVGVILFWVLNNNTETQSVESIETVSDNELNEATESEQTNIEEETDINTVSLGVNGRYLIDLPTAWQMIEDTTISRTSEAYVYDPNDELVMIFTSPLPEVGFESQSTIKDVTINSDIAPLELIVTTDIDADNEDGVALLFYRGDDFLTTSFQITIPYRQGLFAKNGAQAQAGQGDPMRYNSLQDFLDEESQIVNILSTIRTK